MSADSSLPPKPTSSTPPPGIDHRVTAILGIALDRRTFQAIHVHCLWEGQGLSDKTIGNQASTLLGKMVRDGLLTKQGHGRGTTYSPVLKGSKQPTAKDKDDDASE